MHKLLPDVLSETVHSSNIVISEADGSLLGSSSILQGYLMSMKIFSGSVTQRIAPNILRSEADWQKKFTRGYLCSEIKHTHSLYCWSPFWSPSTLELNLWKIQLFLRRDLALQTPYHSFNCISDIPGAIGLQHHISMKKPEVDLNCNGGPELSTSQNQCHLRQQ